MLADILTVFALCLFFLSLWIVRGNWRPRRANHSSAFREIDLPALRNLVSREEDLFLLSTLSHDHYVKLRRARVRAIQQYLGWIMENCAVLLRLLSQPRSESPLEFSAGQVHGLARSAIQLRLRCLGAWSLLWIEYAFPILGISPGTLVRSYERMKEAGEPFIAGTAKPQPVMFANEPRI